MMITTNNIAQIAEIILQDWKNVNFAARPYLNAMRHLESIDQNYFMEQGAAIVRGFLNNAGTWRGPVARAVKEKLKSIIGG
jgi:hypothetical protein